MRCGHADPHRQLAQREFADAMHATRIGDRKTRACFGKNVFAFCFRERDVGLVMQANHGPAVIVIAHPAFEARKGTSAMVEQCIAQWRDIDRVVVDYEAFHFSHH